MALIIYFGPILVQSAPSEHALALQRSRLWGAPAIDLAVATDAVWVANGSDGTVSRIDPSADAVVETIDLRSSSVAPDTTERRLKALEREREVAAAPSSSKSLDATVRQLLNQHRDARG